MFSDDDGLTTNECFPLSTREEEAATLSRTTTTTTTTTTKGARERARARWEVPAEREFRESLERV